MIAAVPIGLRLSHRGQQKQEQAKPAPTAREQVVAALEATTKPGSFRIAYRMEETPGPTPAPVAPSSNLGGIGTINLHPFAVVTLSNVSNLGQVVVWEDGATLWEQGGANHGMLAGMPVGPGAPLSQFGDIVEGTFGPRLGSLVMLNLASPTAHLNLPESAILGVSKTGAGSVGDVAVTTYDVTIDRSKGLALPGMTTEQMRVSRIAFGILQQEGYRGTTLVISVDQTGFIRKIEAKVTFADGGTVSTATELSDFGCAGRVVISQQNGAKVVPEVCAPSAPGAPPKTA